MSQKATSGGLTNAPYAYVGCSPVQRTSETPWAASAKPQVSPPALLHPNLPKVQCAASTYTKDLKRAKGLPARLSAYTEKTLPPSTETHRIPSAYTLLRLHLLSLPLTCLTAICAYKTVHKCTNYVSIMKAELNRAYSRLARNGADVPVRSAYKVCVHPSRHFLLMPENGKPSRGKARQAG